MLNVGRLRILTELHRRHTLVAVAEALSYSTSAVSQQIRQLEKEVGLPLVEPAGRRLILTLQGEILVKHAEKILEDLERAHADVLSSMDQLRGKISIAGFQSSALTLIPRMMQEVAQRYPALAINFVQGEPAETLPALASAQVDLVITESYPGIAQPAIQGIEFTPVMSDALWLTMSAQISDELDHTRPLVSQLEHVGWAMESEKTPPRLWVTSECRNAGFEPRIVCESEDLAVQLRFVESGQAVALLPGLSLQGIPATVRRFPVGTGARKRNILAATRAAARDDAASNIVIRSLQQVAEDITSTDTLP